MMKWTIIASVFAVALLSSSVLSAIGAPVSEVNHKDPQHILGVEKELEDAIDNQDVEGAENAAEEIQADVEALEGVDGSQKEDIDNTVAEVKAEVEEYGAPEKPVLIALKSELEEIAEEVNKPTTQAPTSPAVTTAAATKAVVDHADPQHLLKLELALEEAKAEENFTEVNAVGNELEEDVENLKVAESVKNDLEVKVENAIEAYDEAGDNVVKDAETSLKEALTALTTTKSTKLVATTARATTEAKLLQLEEELEAAEKKGDVDAVFDTAVKIIDASENLTLSEKVDIEAKVEDVQEAVMDNAGEGEVANVEDVLKQALQEIVKATVATVTTPATTTAPVTTTKAATTAKTTAARTTRRKQTHTTTTPATTQAATTQAAITQAATTEATEEATEATEATEARVTEAQATEAPETTAAASTEGLTTRRRPTRPTRTTAAPGAAADSFDLAPTVGVDAEYNADKVENSGSTVFFFIALVAILAGVALFYRRPLTKYVTQMMGGRETRYQRLPVSGNH